MNTPRKYWKTASMAAATYVGDSPLFVLDLLLRFVRVIVLLAIWRTILANKGVVSGMSLGAVLTYTLVAEVFAEQVAVRTRLGVVFWDGTIANHFLQPMGLVGQFTADLVGRWAFGFALCSLPLLLVAPLLGVNPLPASAGAGLIFAISILLAISVGLAIDFIFGALTVVLDQGVWLIDYLRNALQALLSGSLLPLALLPWGLGGIFGWLPFASMASAPLRIYTGTGDPWRLLPVQLVWAVLLWPLAGWLWHTNREKLAGYGG